MTVEFNPNRSSDSSYIRHSSQSLRVSSHENNGRYYLDRLKIERLDLESPVIRSVLKYLFTHCAVANEMSGEMLDSVFSVIDQSVNQQGFNLNMAGTTKGEQQVVSDALVDQMMNRIPFSDAFDSMDVSRILGRVYNTIKDRISNEVADQLFRAEFQSADALMSYLDNLIATKASQLSTIKSIYGSDTEDVMNEYGFFHVFGSESINEVQSDSESVGAYVSKDVLDQALVPNLIEIIIAEELLTDRLPTGILQYNFSTHNRHMNPDFLSSSFKLINNDDVIFDWEFRFEYMSCRCEIYEKNISIGRLEYEMYSQTDRVKHIKGIIRGKSILIVNSQTNSNYFYKAKVGDWRGRVSQYRLNQTRGKWQLSSTIKKAHYAKFHIETESDSHFKVSKQLKIGEDYIVNHAIYVKDFPIPIYTAGFIRNNTFVPPSVIFLPGYGRPDITHISVD
jgi:hypothetical protein